MLILHALKEAYQSLKTHIYRTLSMGFGVLWAIFILVLLLGVGNGFREGVFNAFAKYGVKTMIVSGGRSAGSSPLMPVAIGSNLSKELFSAIQHISPVSGHATPLRYATQTVASRALGCDPCYPLLANLSMQEGRFFTPHDEAAGNNVCVMGICVKERLFGAASPIGKYIFLKGIALQVVGVLDPLDASLYSESDAILIANSLFRSIFPKRRDYANTIRLTLAPTVPAEKMEARLRTYLARHLHVDVNDRQAIRLFSMAKHADKFDKFFKNIAIFNTIIGICLLITGIVTISNMMLVTIQERRQEMAIRKVLGGRSIEIVAMILAEVAMVTLLAGMIGCTIGWGLMQLLNKWIVPLCKTYYLAPLSCPPSYVFGGLGLIALTSCFAGILPAVRALRIKPVEALGSK